MENRKKIQLGKKKIVIQGTQRRGIKAAFTDYYRSHKVLSYTLVSCIAILVLFGVISSLFNSRESTLEKDKLPAMEIKAPVMSKTDFEHPYILPDIAKKEPFSFVKEIIEVDTPFKEFMLNRGHDYATSVKLAFQAKFLELLSFKTPHVLYTFKSTRKQSGVPATFYIYEISMDSFAVILTYPKVEVQLRTIPLTTKVKEMGGLVDHHFFWSSFLNNGGDYRLIPDLLNALRWQIDFYHVKPNDRYKIIFEEKWADGKQAGLGNVLAVYYRQQQREFYAFRYENKGRAAYFDKNGHAMKLQFLMSPVEYDIINSPFDLNRVHPVHKKEMPHFGTDYYAHLNDPVFAVGEGRVMEAKSTANNGNYVKLWHDEQYQTQYLHLNKFAEGIKPGAMVEQGQTIGYAGQTGLATGVHVCFRFWMNGKQVDHTKAEIFQNTASSTQIDNFSSFEEHRDSLMALLENINDN